MLVQNALGKLNHEMIFCLENKDVIPGSSQRFQNCELKELDVY